MALKAKGKWAIQRFIDDGVEFREGNVSGRVFGSWAGAPKGRLSDYAPELHFSAELGELLNEADLRVEVLYSYATPIALRAITPTRRSKWEVLPYSHSPTTVNHRNVAAIAAGSPGFYDGTW